MKKPSANRELSVSSQAGSRWLWFVVAGCAAVTVVGLLFPFSNRRANLAGNEPSSSDGANRVARTRMERIGLGRGSSAADLAPSAGQIVSNKVVQFVRSRRELVGKMAEHFKVEVPVGVDQFLNVAETGSWDELQTLFQMMQAERRKQEGPQAEAMARFWPVLNETYGVLEQSHAWPAQKLLDYGKAILGSLRPEMVYVGGTDPGRFIPTLLNETGDSGLHVVLTQNAFADNSYLDYVRFLYADRLKMLSPEDSQRAFQEYLADAQRRLQHDLQSPGEQKLLRRGEDVQIQENRVQVSGQVAVMTINEALLTTLMQKNPDLSFAMEESFSLPSTYFNATPLGPIMELRVEDPQDALTPDKAALSLDYWRSTAQQLLADTELAESSETRRAWSQMAAAQGNLFANRNLPGEAEQAYRIAAELAPTELGPVSQLAGLLARAGRAAEAGQLLDTFAARNPGQSGKVDEKRSFLAIIPKR
jgi:hypothetical protein